MKLFQNGPYLSKSRYGLFLCPPSISSHTPSKVRTHAFEKNSQDLKSSEKKGTTIVLTAHETVAEKIKGVRKRMLFSDAKKDYVNHMRYEIMLSERTVVTYQCWLNRYERWMDGEGFKSAEIETALDTGVSRRFQYSLAKSGGEEDGKPLRPRTIRGAFNALRCYLKNRMGLTDNSCISVFGVAKCQKTARKPNHFPRFGRCRTNFGRNSPNSLPLMIPRQSGDDTELTREKPSMASFFGCERAVNGTICPKSSEMTPVFTALFSGGTRWASLINSGRP